MKKTPMLIGCVIVTCTINAGAQVTSPSRAQSPTRGATTPTTPLPAPVNPAATPANPAPSSAVGSPSPSLAPLPPQSPPLTTVPLSSGGVPANRTTPLTSGGSPNPSEVASTPGGGGKTLEDCMSFWDRGTHMTKAEWRAACKRTIARIGGSEDDAKSKKTPTESRDRSATSTAR
jgi:hypothetical protein